MAQNYGLGRGLASLIPQKRKSVPFGGSQPGDEAEKKVVEPKEDFNYFGASAAPGSVAAAIKANPVSTASPKNSGAEKDNGAGNEIREVEMIKIVPNPHQPRLSFNDEKLEELAGSIKEHGIIQPITVTKNNGNFEIVTGERRFQAAKMAGLKTVPVIVRDANEKQKLELAITENVQRHDLDAIEEAKAYKKLIEEFEMNQEEVAKKIGISRSAVANKIRLLGLPVEIQKALIAGDITEGHCKLLLAISNPERQKAFYEMILKNKLTVKQTETKTKEFSVKTHKRTLHIDPEIKQIEDELSQKLGTKVKLTKSGGGGRIIVEYYSQEELNNILDKIAK
ncbi:MAG TPA: ParB/RepB/Spo0J family partition protein [Candidatus Moranbacteria bacterium]|nr:ParB/RepB/Spo0J family partition protein [Candidatus Moranbacteria bacterium]